MKVTLLILVLIAYLSICNGDIIERKRRRRHHSQKHHNKNKKDAQRSSAHVVVSKEGPPPAPQEYTISKIETAVVCDERGDKTWAKWKEYDLDGVCARLQYYGEIEGQCETDCDKLCPQGFYEVAKEKCVGKESYGGASGLYGSGYYRQCVGRYKCTQSSYDYWVNLKWWQFLIWEVVIVILGCCFFGLAVGCCIRCYYRRRGGRGGGRGGGGGGGGGNRGSGGGGGYGNVNRGQPQNYNNQDNQQNY